MAHQETRPTPESAVHHDPRVLRLTGMDALEHAARTHAPLMRWPGLFRSGGAVGLEDAFREASQWGPGGFYVDVETSD